MFANTLQVVITELVLGINQWEEALHQSGPEVWQNLRQTDAAAWGMWQKKKIIASSTESVVNKCSTFL